MPAARSPVPDLAHELRTPLNNILGWVLLMRSQPGDARIQAEGLAVIERNVRLQAQVLADFSELDALDGPLPAPAPERTDLIAVLRGAGVAMPDGLLPGGPVDVLAEPAPLARLAGLLLRLCPVPDRLEAARAGDVVGLRVAGAGGGATRREAFTGPPLRAGSSLEFALARRLAIRQGGDLSVEAAGDGLVFVLTLPAPP